ncbi:MAG TPA: hypothetical protein VJH63_02940 [Candidatus Paceibacterota bacterium]
MVGQSTSPITEVVATTTPSIEVPKTIKEKVTDYFKDDPIMIKIAWCESRFRQFEKDGSVFRGKVNPNDVGVMQVNTTYHLKKATSLELDLDTLEGNLAYAKYLFLKEGTVPWNSSGPCWKNQEIAMK